MSDEASQNDITYAGRITYLQDASKLYRNLVLQRVDGKVPDDLIHLIQLQMGELQIYGRLKLLDIRLAGLRSMVKLTTILGCHHKDQTEEEACRFKEVHARIRVQLERLESKYEGVEEKNE
ncbi:MAG: hypothetical protein L6R40_004095 [Gallowayella cf. fulva]|nr:MAG: hypothetical protein L6R40_004095 [Xanthomendoza cf. fulva]